MQSPRAGAGGVRCNSHLAVPAIFAAIASLALAGVLRSHPQPLLLWNSTASSPPGLYAIGAAADVKVGDMIVAWPPPAARRLASVRNYLPQSVPLIKRVAAVGGDRVCANGSLVTINGRASSHRRSADPRGRPLPWWSSCHKLQRDELFLLSPDSPLAFDGRYFGVTRSRQIIGKARLLWPS